MNVIGGFKGSDSWLGLTLGLNTIYMHLAVAFVTTGQLIFVFTKKIFSEVKINKYSYCGSYRW